VVSDPKACNNIVIKDQALFEETEAFLEYVYSFRPTFNWLLTPFPTEGISRYLGQRSFRPQVSSYVPKLFAFLITAIQVITTVGNGNY
jgi:hypothetical protein